MTPLGYNDVDENHEKPLLGTSSAFPRLGFAVSLSLSPPTHPSFFSTREVQDIPHWARGHQVHDRVGTISHNPLDIPVPITMGLEFPLDVFIHTIARLARAWSLDGTS